jgi:hypothetical protein
MKWLKYKKGYYYFSEDMTEIACLLCGIFVCELSEKGLDRFTKHLNKCHNTCPLSLLF